MVPRGVGERESEGWCGRRGAGVREAVRRRGAGVRGVVRRGRDLEGSGDTRLVCHSPCLLPNHKHQKLSSW